MQEDILRVENLSRIYGQGENEVCALGHVSFSVRKGEFVSVIGASGSGKSTLLHLIGGVDRPTEGKVGLIYQFYNLIPVLTVEENMTLPVLMDGRSVNQKRVEELLDILKLKDRRGYLPGQLSGGQQQRVSIGRALMNAPAVVLADEPTGNLDSGNSREIVELLKYSNRIYDQTMIMITHDEDIALQADRLIELADGRIIRDEVIRG